MSKRCMKDCYEGSNFAKRNIKTKGSLDYMKALAKGFANLNQINIIIYERTVLGKGTFYDFEPEGKKDFKVLVKFDRKDSDEDVLSDSKDTRSKSSKSKKDKSKQEPSK